MRSQPVVLSLFLSVAAAAGAQDPPPGSSDFVRGQRAVLKRDPNGAIQAFEAALDINPNLTLCHYYLGYAYEANKNWIRAGESFSEFIASVDSGDPRAVPLVNHANRQAGLAFARTSRARQAIPYLERSLASNAADVDARYYLGIAYMKSDEPEKAEAQLRIALELDASRTDAHYYRGVIARDRGDEDGAAAHLERFLELAPRSVYAADAHFALAAMAVERARAGAADESARPRAHLEKFLEIRPRSPRAARAHFLLGALALEAGDHESAVSHLERSLELEPEGELADRARALLSPP